VSDYIEMCTKAAYYAYIEPAPEIMSQYAPGPGHPCWERIVRAVLEAGRLSRCPAAVRAADMEHWCNDEGCTSVETILEAAEDAVLGSHT
jgi:hypothetical protein